MSARVMSAAGWGIAGGKHESRQEGAAVEEQGALHPSSGWNPCRFEREQIRSLVRQVFSPRSSPPVRQVVFSAVEAQTEVQSLCLHVAETLAVETSGDVVVVGGQDMCVVESDGRTSQDRAPHVREWAKRVHGNLWQAPGMDTGENRISTASVHKYLAEIRREFEYSIVAASPAGESNEALAMAQFADGMILVLSAKHTRRATALKVKDMLSQVRLLGTVLTDREFPIPEGIYHRL